MLVGGYKRRDDQLVHFSGHLVNETEKAYSVSESSSATRGTWLPKSLLRNVETTNLEISCDMPEWLAKERNLI